jgi:endo-1,4-beta-xylanase
LGASAAQTGRYFGAAVAANKLSDGTYVGILDREFNAVTPENEMKWDATEPSQGTFRFTASDQIVSHAQSHGQRMRGHTLAWHSAAARLGAEPYRHALRNAMINHITQVATHYRGKIYAWDVVNEAFADGTAAPGATPTCSAPATTGSRSRSAPRGPPTPARSSATTTTTPTGQPEVDRHLQHGRRLQGPRRPDRLRRVPVAPHQRARPGLPGQPAALRQPRRRRADHRARHRRRQPGHRLLDRERACLAVSRCAGITVWGIRDSDSWRTGQNPLLFDGSATRRPRTPPSSTRSTAPARRPAARSIPTPGTCCSNRNSGKALDLFNFATNDGARITQWTRSNNNNQQWQFVDSGGGFYRIRSRHSGKVLDVLNRSTADGATVAQWTDNGGTNQQWRLADVDRRLRRVSSTATAARRSRSRTPPPPTAPTSSSSPTPVATTSSGNSSRSPEGATMTEEGIRSLALAVTLSLVSLGAVSAHVDPASPPAGTC